MARQSAKPAMGESEDPGDAGRFVATIHPGPYRKDLSDLDRIDLDVLPTELRGAVVALVSANDLVTLVDRGFEVRLVRHYRAEPVNPSMVFTDADAERWLEARLAEVQAPKTEAGKSGKRKS